MRNILLIKLCLHGRIQVEIEKLAGKVPVLLVNTQDFDWKALRDIRTTFMKARAEAKEEGSPLITELKTIKVFENLHDISQSQLLHCYFEYQCVIVVASGYMPSRSIRFSTSLSEINEKIWVSLDLFTFLKSKLTARFNGFLFIWYICFIVN